MTISAFDTREILRLAHLPAVANDPTRLRAVGALLRTFGVDEARLNKALSVVALSLTSRCFVVDGFHNSR